MKTSTALVLALAALASACSDSPTEPTPTPPPTVTLRSITLSGDLAGLKTVGQTTPLTATGTFSDGTMQLVTTSCVNWQSDNTTVLTIDGTGRVTARGNGTATITTTCQGVFARGTGTVALTPIAPPIPACCFTQSGMGANVFTMPTYVTRVRIFADYGGNCENFIVHINNRSVVNEILGSCSVATSGRHYDGTIATSGGLVEVLNSSGISWTFVEVR